METGQQDNLERWKLYMKEIKSPDSYIELGFYFMIGMALQRRVWVGDGSHKLFPNIYSILCAPPGVGKGLLLCVIKTCLKYYKFDEFQNPRKLDALTLQAIESGTEEEQKSEDKKLLFPLAADAMTYEKLINFNASCLAALSYTKEDPVSHEKKTAYYTHSSMGIVLPEMSSLFKRNSQAIVEYLLAVFDNGEYTYATKNCGTDRVRRTCVSFLAGTTPIFIQTSVNESLFEDGFFSRMLLVYEERNRFYKFGIPKFTTEQNLALCSIIQHLRTISRVFGEVEWEPEAENYMIHYFEKVLPYNRINKSPRLEHYYARKDIIATKLALAIHFSENLSMKLTLNDATRAVKFLNSIENRMHLPFSVKSTNPLAVVGNCIVKWLEEGGVPKSYNEIWREFVGQANHNQMQETINFLQATGQIKSREKTNQNGKLITQFYVDPKGPGGAKII